MEKILDRILLFFIGIAIATAPVYWIERLTTEYFYVCLTMLDDDYDVVALQALGTCPEKNINGDTLTTYRLEKVK